MSADSKNTIGAEAPKPEPAPPWMEDNPQYWPSKLKDYKGNPVAECIRPLPDTDDELIKSLTHAPWFEKSELELPNNVRMLLPERLLDVFIGTANHLPVNKWLYRRLLSSYRSPARNPMSPEGQHLLHYKTSPAMILPGKIGMLTALSGMGKSALVRNILLSFGKPVIRHHAYDGKNFTETQILYLLRDAPAQSSLKMFAQQYGRHTDALLGQKMYTPHFSDPRQNRESLIDHLGNIVVQHFIGLLVVDLAENLTAAGPDGYEGFAAEFERIRDTYGISIVLIGTYKLVNKLRAIKTSSLWRKIQEGGYYEIKRPLSADDPEFRHISSSLWKYSWLREPIKYTDEIASTLYTCSSGNTGVMVTLIIAAQLEALELGREKVDAKLLHKVYQTRFTPLHEILDALRLGRKDILDNFDDLYKKKMGQVVNDNLLAGFRLALQAQEQTNGQKVGSKPTEAIVPKKPAAKAAVEERVAQIERIAGANKLPSILTGT